MLCTCGSWTVFVLLTNEINVFPCASHILWNETRRSCVTGSCAWTIRKVGQQQRHN